MVRPLLLALMLSLAGPWQPGQAQKGAHYPHGTRAAGDWFGYSVALSGDLSLVGAIHDVNNDVTSGSAYIFERQADGTWTRTARLVAPDGAELDEFGEAVALSGTRALVGAPWVLGPDGLSNIGAAYIFERQAGGAWTQTSRLTPDVPLSHRNAFGYVVAMSDERALVASQAHDSLDGSGSVYVFERQPDGAWSQTARLTAGDAASFDLFGNAVALSGDRAVATAPGDEDNGNASGSAYVFERQPDGIWIQVTKLTPGDGTPMAWFGGSVALLGDRVLVGAEEDEIGGSTYVFERQPDGRWTETAKLKARDAAPGNWFGSSVALSRNRALIGAAEDCENGPFSGAAYVFERYPDGTWIQAAKLHAGDNAALSDFGSVVALSGDQALIGAPFYDTPYSIDEGTAYVFERQPDGAWTRMARLTPSDTTVIPGFTLRDAATDRGLMTAR